MSEEEYWLHLEYRLCREFIGLAEKNFRGFWCDGFIPELFDIRSEGAIITGQAWLGRSSREQESWHFCLLVGREVRAREEIQWAKLLPAEDVTGWLFVDPAKRTVTIKPLVAYPDYERKVQR